MTFSAFRLPTGVGCLNKEGNIFVFGPCGSVKIVSNSMISREGDMVKFFPPLSFGVSSLFIRAVLGVIVGYEINLVMEGMGYKVEQKKEQLL